MSKCFSPALALACTLTVASSVNCSAIELELTLESGSVLLAEIPLKTIHWSEVQSNGDMTVRRVPTSNIQRLSLSSSPASNQVSEIRQLINTLQSKDYRARENAEHLLSSPELGGRFPKMLQQHRNSPDAELRYRIGRILNKISDSAASAPMEFDELLLKSGKILRGDAGDFQFQCNIDGQTLSLERSQLRMVRVRESPPELAGGSQPVETEIVLDSEGKFYLPRQQTIQLETDPLGNELARKTDIRETYIPYGIRFGSIEPGYVGISGYGFKFPHTPTGDNSGSVFLESRSGDRIRYKKFRGTLVIDFCLPNQPYIPAGVNEFGLHIANVEHERDFILEAFNTFGQVIATVEAGERDCPFMGVRSNTLISRVQIRANPFLKRLKRRIDDDYAFDSVCFSKPIAIDGPPVTRPDDSKASIKLVSGNHWVGHRIAFRRDGSAELTDIRLKTQPDFTAKSIRSYTFAKRSTKLRPKRRSWSVQLVDGSILNVSPGETFRSQLSSNYIVPHDQIVALWPSEAVARLPHNDDWNMANHVIALPTGRLLTNEVKFSKLSYHWQTIDKRLQELSSDANQLARDEDPTPNIEEIIYREVDAESSPTLWLKQPRTISTKVGLVQLTDGQRLVFGKGQQLKLIDRGKDSIKFKLNKDVVEIENDRIQFVRLETK